MTRRTASESGAWVDSSSAGQALAGAFVEPEAPPVCERSVGPFTIPRMFSGGDALSFAAERALGDLDPMIAEWPSDDDLLAESAHRKRKRELLRKKLLSGECVGWIGSDWRRFAPAGWVWSSERSCFVRAEEGDFGVAGEGGEWDASGLTVADDAFIEAMIAHLIEGTDRVEDEEISEPVWPCGISRKRRVKKVRNVESPSQG